MGSAPQIQDENKINKSYLLPGSLTAQLIQQQTQFQYRLALEVLLSLV